MCVDSLRPAGPFHVCPHLSWCPSPRERLCLSLLSCVLSVSVFVPSSSSSSLFLVWAPLVLTAFPIARSVSLCPLLSLFFSLLLFLSLVSCCDYVSTVASLCACLFISVTISASLLPLCVPMASSLSPTHLFVAAECADRGQRLEAPACLGLN